MKNTGDISIFRYGDYRKFLRDFYEWKKKSSAAFSYQALASRAGFKSKTFLHKIIHGEKAIPIKSIQKVANAIGLAKREADYFEALVLFNEAETLEERQETFNRMQMINRYGQETRVREDQVAYFSKWYVPVVREAITINDFKEDYEALGQAIEPSITASQARKAVELLLRLEMVRKLPSGRYEQTQQALTTDGSFIKLGVHSYQKEMNELATRSIATHPMEKRDISTLTMGISKKGFEQVRDELRMVRKRIAEIANQDNPADRVYHLNLQLFPVTGLPKDEK